LGFHVGDKLQAFDMRHVMRYNIQMIKTFKNSTTEKLFYTGGSPKLPPDVVARAVRKLTLIDAATSVEDLRVPPSNRLHKLEGSRAGQYSVSVNDQWRICFRFVDGDAYDVEFCDYH
jgi:proteic killer suppression protein